MGVFNSLPYEQPCVFLSQVVLVKKKITKVAEQSLLSRKREAKRMEAGSG